MAITQIHVVAFSPCGGTMRVLRGMTDPLGLPTRECDLTLPHGRQQIWEFGPDDLVFIGLPVYGGRVPRIADELFGALQGAQTPAVLAAVYGNRDYEDALLEMQKRVAERGFVPFAGVAAIAEHTYQPLAGEGRPDALDMAALAEFGHAAVNVVEQNTVTAAAAVFTAPGVEPYRKPPLQVPFTPAGDADACIYCGICTSVCPTGAISDEDQTLTDKEKCITCMACIKICPHGARAITEARYGQMAAWLAENCSERKEIQFFPSKNIIEST